MSIAVTIVEDDRKTREGLVALLRRASGVRLLGVHSSGEAALSAVPAEQPEVVLMDINLPGMSGIDCIAKLKAQMPELRALMLTTYEDSHLIFNSLRAGASGYILKNKSSAELLTAIQQVHEGGAPMSMRIARKVVAFFNQLPGPASESQSLSEREAQVLAALAKGLIYKEIATELKISENTVRTYIKRIYEKLHVNSRTEAVAKFRVNLSGGN
ncbi:MAG TPA: response regulator transcription factor [Verrucomicrobiae bacterium]|jgi:DNA-binding NarL/FixJ family response regulator|nr:response regulator transcription factor [Verrucomicrobiae bacterium]